MRTLYSDFTPGNLLHIVLCRSYELGTFDSVSLEAELPEDYFFFTAENLAKKAVQINGVEVPFLADKAVSYAGEGVAIIAGEDEKVCKSLSEKVKINFIGDVQIPKYEEKGISAIAERKIGSDEEREKVFSECATVLENAWNITLDFQAVGECTGAICQLVQDAVIISTQSEDSEIIKEAVSSVIDKKIIVNKMPSPLQKNTNAEWNEAFCAALCAVIAETTDFNTKIVFSRHEQKTLIETPLHAVLKCRTAVSDTGEIVANEMEIEADMGFVNPMSRYIVDYLANTNYGVYHIPLFKITATALNSSHTPAGMNKHTISAAAFFALENQMNEIAKKLALLPTEIRTQQSAIIDAVAKKSDFARKYVSYKLNAIRRVDPNAKKCLPFSTPLRGIGLSAVSEDATTAAVVVELELDPCTFRQKIRALHLVIDCGKVENVSAAITVLKRDIHQITRQLVKNDTIEIAEKSISFITSEKQSSHIGEIVFNGIPAAYTSALSQILSTRIDEFPLDTESVFNLYQKNCIVQTVQNRREPYETIADTQRS